MQLNLEQLSPAKQQAIRLIDAQPDDASYDELLNQLILTSLHKATPTISEQLPIWDALRVLYHTNYLQFTQNGKTVPHLHPGVLSIYPDSQELKDNFVADEESPTDHWADMPYVEPEGVFIAHDKMPTDYWADMPYSEDDFPKEPPFTPEGIQEGLDALEEIKTWFPALDVETTRYIAESHELSLDYQFELELSQYTED